MNMYIINRKGEKEPVVFDEIMNRIKKLCYGFPVDAIDHSLVAKKTIEGMKNGMTTTEIDMLSAQVAASLVVEHDCYSQLASRLTVSNIHKNSPKTFSEAMKKLYEYKQDGVTHTPIISKELYEISQKHAKKINAAIVEGRDLTMYDYFGIKTLEKSYLLDINKIPVETPQYMYMRVAIGLHGNDLNAAFETYELMSTKFISHASPTQFNAGTNRAQMSSCYLMPMQDDSIEGIYATLGKSAMLSRGTGATGISLHNIRSKSSYIAGSRGRSNGIVPMLRVFNETARYVDQGGGKRQGAIAMYLEPWHGDIVEFLELKKNHGAEETKARDLFYALWIPDLFMKRVEEDGEWSLFCPKVAPGLFDVHSKEFEDLYTKYETEGRALKVMKARDLWFKIINAQIETGSPYMLYKDACNQKSNQQNLGTIRSSNLCAEIIEYSSKDETAVCNLASLVLSSFVKEDKTMDLERLHEVAKITVRNLNKTIDRTAYPIESAELSNFKHRPIGIGVQGLADVFAMMKLSFDSLAARKLNTDIFETMYHGAMEASLELAKVDGAYSSFKGSPLSKGLFQFDLWHYTPDSGRYDWNALRKEVMEHGVRNSLLLAPMPTATTAQILSNNEGTEAFTSNMYVRRVLSGEFIVVNKYLLKELRELGVWSEELKNQIIANEGSVQGIDEIPEDMQHRYRTVLEIPSKSIIDMAADRGVYVCQSQSMNIFMKNADTERVTAMHFYGWKKGLKTGMYYLRNTAAREAVKFTIRHDKKTSNNADTANVNAAKEAQSSATTLNAVDATEDPNVCFGCGA